MSKSTIKAAQLAASRKAAAIKAAAAKRGNRLGCVTSHALICRR